MRDFYMRYVGPSGANSNSELRDFYMQRYTGSPASSNSNSNRTRRVRSRSPSNSNRTRRAPSRSPSRSSAAPGRLIGSRTPSSPPGAPLRGRLRSRSSPSSGSGSSGSTRSRKIRRGDEIEIRIPPNAWKVEKLNNLPKEDPLLRNFNSEGKAIKVSWKKQGGKTHSEYYTPESIVGLTLMQWKGLGINYRTKNLKPYKTIKKPLRWIYWIQERGSHYTLFEHPTTRKDVQRKNLEFVRLEKRTNKNKAATKIQAAFRGGRERQKTLNKAKRMTALITSKKRRRN